MYLCIDCSIVCVCPPQNSDQYQSYDICIYLEISHYQMFDYRFILGINIF